MFTCRLPASRSFPLVALAAAATLAVAPAAAQHWPGFRGPHRDGVAAGAAAPPLEWSADENIAWRAALPGAGSSSPIVWGDRVFVTCFSGFGADPEEEGEPDALEHHLVCVNRKTGELEWDAVVDGGHESMPSRMQLREHGFSSPTPVTADGETIYAYFGKVGVVAVTGEGEILWTQPLGTFDYEEGVDPLGDDRPKHEGRPISMRWGAGSSPLLHGDLLIVNASEESDTIRALNRHNGELVWKRAAPRLEGCSISPVVVGRGDHEVLVIVMAGEVWGLDVATGVELWKVETGTTTGMCPTPVADSEVVYTFGGGGKAHALRFARDLAGQEGEPEVLERIAWTSKKNVDVPSPILTDGKLFLIDTRGMGAVLDAKTGELGFNGRLPGRTGGIYASPVLAGNRIYQVSRERGTFVYSADGEFELLAKNVIDGDDSQFHGTPAVVGNELFLRSQKFLYCIAARGS